MDGTTTTLIAAGIAAAASLFTAGLTLYHNSKTLAAQRAAERRRQLSTSLQELLLPLSSRLMSMQAVFRVFTANKPKGFRTLEYLLAPNTYTVENSGPITLSDSDRKLLDEIVRLGGEIEALLLAKGSLVDDPVLQQNYVPDPNKTDVSPEVLKGMGLFALAITHLHLFRLAWQGALSGDPTAYKAFVYPRELNTKVYEAIQKARQELVALG